MESGDDVRERTIIPTLRYRDVAWAIAWLSDAFGFETHTVVDGGEGSVEYAELIFGNGMIMIGPVEDPAVRSSAQPQPTGGAEIQSCYVRIDDPTAHRARAMAAGAEIVLDIEDGRSGRGYSCRDPEGHIWHFGTYEPRRRRRERASLKDKLGRVIDAGVRRRPFGIGLATTTLIAASVAAWALAVADPDPVSASAAAEQSGALRAERELRELRELRGQLQQARIAREEAEKSARAATDQLAHLAQTERDRARREAQEQLGRDRVAREAGEHLAKERAAKQDLERANRKLRLLLARERHHRWRRRSLARAPMARAEADAIRRRALRADGGGGAL